MTDIDKLIKDTNSAKLNLELAQYGDDLDSENRNVGMYFLEKCEELAKTHDINGLFCLLDYFDEEFDIKYNGALERLQNNIFDNYSYDEIIEAFYEKFDQLLKKNMDRACVLCMDFFYWEEDFEKFRTMFNTVKSCESGKFLIEIYSWLPDDCDAEIGKEGVEILREDMKKW